jgi:hypothetical protein
LQKARYYVAAGEFAQKQGGVDAFCIDTPLFDGRFSFIC